MTQLFVHSSPLSCRSAFDISGEKRTGIWKKERKKEKSLCTFKEKGLQNGDFTHADDIVA